MAPKAVKAKVPSKSKAPLVIGVSLTVVLIGVLILAVTDQGDGMPKNPNAVLLGVKEYEQKHDFEGAAEYLLAVIAKYPTFVEAHYNVAIYFRHLGRYGDAAHHNEIAIRLRPHFPEALVNLGIAYENMGERGKARDVYKKSLQQKPGFYEGLNSLAILDSDEGLVDSALSWYKQCLKVRDTDAVRIKMAMLLPPVYKSAKDMKDRWTQSLESLNKLAKRQLSLPNDAHFDVGATYFYLAYTGYDNKEHMKALYRVMAKADPTLNFVAPHLRPFIGKTIPNDAVPLTAQGKIKVGIISRHLRNHSIGKFMRGIFASLPRSKIELIAIFPGQETDGVSDFIANAADRSLRVPTDLKAAREAIFNLKLHVLLFADIGMESFTYYLAFSRLAPVQAVTHGHPCTTGLPTLDYFVSFEDYEPAENQKYYTEKLALLKGQSSPYLLPEPPEVLKTREEIGFSQYDHIYMVPQSIFKFHPDYDAVLIKILSQDPLAKLAVISESHKGWTEVVLNRMREQGATDAMLSRFVSLPRASWSEFLNYLAIADVLLDPHPFGGDTSSRESLFMATPVVTLPSKQLAGRYTQAFLKRVGLPELIAKDFDDYVAIAIHVASDREFQTSLRNKLQTTKKNLFGQQDVILAWEQFFLSSVKNAMPNLL